MCHWNQDNKKHIQTYRYIYYEYRYIYLFIIIIIDFKNFLERKGTSRQQSAALEGAWDLEIDDPRF